MNLTKWLFYLFLLSVFVAGFFFYSWIIKYLAGAIIFTYVFNPSVTWLERKRIPRLFSIFVVYAIIGLVIVWSALRVVPIIIDQAQNFMAFVQANSKEGEISLMKVPFIQSLLARVDYVDSQIPILKLHDSFVNLVTSTNKSLMNIPQALMSNYQKILEAISLIATIPLIAFFLLKDDIKFRKYLIKMVPNRYYEIAIIIQHKIDEVVGKYIRAMFFEVLIVGTLSAIALTILGVDYAFLIGLFAGLANIIPYFGPILGVVFASLSVLLAGNPPIMILYVIIAMYLIQVIDNNLVYPFVVGATISMHPLVVLLTVLAGGWAWGITGMLVSVPIVYLIYSIVKVLAINLKEFKII